MKKHNNKECRSTPLVMQIEWHCIWGVFEEWGCKCNNRRWPFRRRPFYSSLAKYTTRQLYSRWIEGSRARWSIQECASIPTHPVVEMFARLSALNKRKGIIKRTTLWSRSQYGIEGTVLGLGYAANRRKFVAWNRQRSSHYCHHQCRLAATTRACRPYHFSSWGWSVWQCLSSCSCCRMENAVLGGFCGFIRKTSSRGW